MRILREEAEDQTSHKVVQLLTALCLVPFGVILQQLDVEAIEATRSLNIKRVFTDLLDCCDACQRQEKTEVVMKVGVCAGDRLAIGKVFCLKAFAVGGEDELGLVPSRRRAIAQGQRRRHLAFGTNLQVDIVALEYAVREVDLFVELLPSLLSRSIVVFLLPKASRKAKGKALESKALRRDRKQLLRFQLHSYSKPKQLRGSMIASSRDLWNLTLIFDYEGYEAPRHYFKTRTGYIN